MNERTFQAADAHKLEDPERLAWLPPKEVVDSLDLQPGIVVADIGAGTGYFALPISRAVGEKGKVLTVDFQTGMLDLIGKKLLEPGAPGNIALIHGTAVNTTLPDSSADFVFMANVWHEFDDHVLVLKEAARVGRGSARLAILDWRTDVASPPGPPLDHRVPVKTVRETLEANRWKVERSGNVGKFSYLVVAQYRHS